MLERSILVFTLLVSSSLGAGEALGQCPAPGAPRITLYSSLPTAKGQTYVLAWDGAIGLDSSGSYVVERSPDPLFVSGLEQFRTSATTASLKSDVTGLFYHRVRGVQGCGTIGPASSSAPITIVDGSPVVIFTTQPPALVRTANGPPSTIQFEVRNLGGRPFAGYISSIGTPFFALSDSGIVLLDPGISKSFTVEFYGTFSNTPGSYQGLLTIQSTSGEQPKAYPWALVNLTVTPSSAGARVLSAAEALPPVVSTDFASFQATNASTDPPPVSISISNPRSTDLYLAAETGPDGWLVPAAGWNATALRPGETRTVSLSSKRIQGQTGGIYPRYAFLTLRTREGQATRVQFQDLDDTSGGPCSSRPVLVPTQSSYLVPSVVTTDFLKDERRVSFVSRLLLSNVGIDSVVADLYFTPDAGSGNPSVDGYDCSRVLRARVAVPGSDVLSLTDPLSKLFGFKPSDNVSGTLEVRSEQLAQLRTDSVVDSPGTGGGYYGFQLPVVNRGVGAAKNRDHLLAGLVSNPTYRTNVIFAETSGASASFTFSVLGAEGTPLLTASRTIPAYGKVQVNDAELFQGQSIAAAALTVTVTSGSGTVLALATIIDRVSQDASTVLSRTVPSEPSGTVRAESRSLASTSYRFVVPSVVNGYNSKPGRGPYPYESTLTLTNGTRRDVTVQLTYDDAASGPRTVGPLTVRARSTLSYANVLKEAFGITRDSTGPLTIDVSQPLVITSRVFSRTDDGVFGDGIPVYPVSTTATTTGASRRLLLADGFEHSISLSYGARSNLILTEITGLPAQVEIRLFEKGKERSGPIGTNTYTLAAREKLQVNDVFGTLGCGGKDRKNVLAEVVALPGSAGSVVAIGTRIDNITADSKVLVLLPVGESQGTPTIGF